MTGPQYPQQPYGQPYPPQQPYPPRKRKVWPWILLAVVVLVFGGCVALIGAAGNEAAKAIDAAASSVQSAAESPDAPIPPLTPKASGKGKTVVYEIISDSDLRSVTYWDENSELQQLNGADAPWSLTITNTSTAVIAGAGAQTNGTSVTCRVTVDGKVKDEKTSTGKYAVVNCTG
ncbi:MmpS family transport accessory protein [Nocardia asiatica]|uniref:MmpS family transport accessory protein n=1 Tax=Nocardia asiatica TaxID=209252 RepID=UPI0003018A53|nr:MmpS family transport accessory protein [Nocardia asiatica]